MRDLPPALAIAVFVCAGLFGFGISVAIAVYVERLAVRWGRWLKVPRRVYDDEVPLRSYLGQVSPGHRPCNACWGLSAPEPTCPECHGDGEVPK